jgi:hypothetical protein
MLGRLVDVLCTRTVDLSPRRGPTGEVVHPSILPPHLIDKSRFDLLLCRTAIAGPPAAMTRLTDIVRQLESEIRHLGRRLLGATSASFKTGIPLPNPERYPNIHFGEEQVKAWGRRGIRKSLRFQVCNRSHMCPV